MSKSKRTAMDIVKLFLKLQGLDEDSGDVITNLKAQKLLYYAQGVALAETGQPLFDEDFRNWQHGPVIPEVYQKLKQFGSNQIELDEELNESLFSDSELEMLIRAYRSFGQYSAWKLRDMTHAEAPWRDTKPDEVITKGAIKKYFDVHYASI